MAVRAPLIALALISAVLIAALWALIRGLWPRRLGSELRCRGCEYQLQGISSDRCPECGLPLTPANTVRGRRYRYRRPILATLGVLGLLGLLVGVVIGGIVAFNAFQHIDWYRYASTSWLIGHVTSSNRATRQASWWELKRRIHDGEISIGNTNRRAGACVKLLPTTSQNDPPWIELRRQYRAGLLLPRWRHAIVALTLQDQRAVKPISFTSFLIDFTARELLAGRLSANQRQTFLSQLMSFTIAARPVVEFNASVPFAIQRIERGPVDTSLLWYSEQPAHFLIDGHIVLEGRWGFGSAEYADWPSVGSEIATAPLHLAPGKHRLQMEEKIAIHPGPMPKNPSETAAVLYKHTIRVSTSFTILPPGAIEPIQQIKKPSLEAKMRKLIAVHGLTLDGRALDVRIQVQPLPVDVIFDVIAVSEGEKCSLTSVKFHANGASDDWGTGGILPKAMQSAKTLTIILRSDPAVARETVDFTKTWVGELKYPNLPVKREK